MCDTRVFLPISGIIPRLIFSSKDAPACVKVLFIFTTRSLPQMVDSDDPEDLMTASEGSPIKNVKPRFNDKTAFLPNYLTSTCNPIKRFEYDDEYEESGELGAGDDSDFDCEDIDDLGVDPADVPLDDDDTSKIVLDSLENQLFIGTGFVLDNAGNVLKVAGVPEDWEPPKRKADMKEPIFEKVDNPGDWHGYSYCPKFEKGKGKKKMYTAHELPSRCVPVPVDKDGDRFVNGWYFHYKGWEVDDKDDEGLSRKHASVKNMFPKERLGSLDADLLRKLGMNTDVLEHNDCLFFFYQLLLPICNIEKSGVEGDPRMSYYSEVENWSNLYAIQIGLDGS